ncbi:MAG: tetratricopeptide repeat protein [Gammaproteobacteria bacterium]|nr:tetratricopeptide repeat protein [Gammaproteobacteria bacterium]
MNLNKKKKQAYTFFQNRQLQEARKLYTEITRKAPKDADAWFFLSIIHGQMGTLPEAEHCCRQTLALQPNAHAAWDNLGLALMMQGRANEAAPCFQKSIQINPRNEKAYAKLGNLLREQGHPVDARKHFNKALEINPNYAEAHNNLGNLLQEQCKFKEALEHYQTAARLVPNYIEAHFNIGTIQQSLGNYESAIEHYHEAHRLRPEFSAPIAGVANIYEKQGEFEAAYKELEPLLKLPVPPSNAAITFANFAKHLDKKDQAINSLNKALSNNQNPPTQIQDMHYALGDLHNANKTYDQAFEHYQKGNQLRPFNFDINIHHAQFEAIKQTFSAENIANIATSPEQNEQAVFILGMPRSGTSLVEQILSAHSQLYGAGELEYMGEILNSLPQRFSHPQGYPGVMSKLSSEDLGQLATEYLGRLNALAPGTPRISDKMPHNFLSLGLISRMLPKAKIIHCKRDPIDTCLSIYFHNFNANHPYANNQKNLATYYHSYVDLMQHWLKVLDIPILEVEYEQLVQDQENQSQRLIEFCGLEWDEKCLQFHKQKRTVTTPSYDQVRQPMYTSSMQRWKRYEKHIPELIAELSK